MEIQVVPCMAFFGSVPFAQPRKAGSSLCALTRCCSDSVLDAADVTGAFGFLCCFSHKSN